MEIEYILMIIAIFAILAIIVKIILDEERSRELYIKRLEEKGYKIMYVYKI